MKNRRIRLSSKELSFRPLAEPYGGSDGALIWFDARIFNFSANLREAGTSVSYEHHALNVKTSHNGEFLVERSMGKTGIS